MSVEQAIVVLVPSRDVVSVLAGEVRRERATGGLEIGLNGDAYDTGSGRAIQRVSRVD